MCEFTKTNNLDRSRVGNENDEVVGDGGSVNEGSSPPAKNALRYVKILCFLSSFFVDINIYGRSTPSDQVAAGRTRQKRTTSLALVKYVWESLQLYYLARAG